MGPDGLSTIAAAVGFSPDELALNRVGRVSDRQRTRLAQMRRGGRIGLVVIGLFAIAFVVVIAVVLVPKLTKQQHGSSKVPIVPIVAGVLAFVLLVMTLSIVRSRRRLDRLASGVVHEVNGPARTRVHVLPGNVDDSGGSEGGGTRYELTIGSTTFYVGGKHVLDAFADGGVYRAYFATGGGHTVWNRLLSAERIG
jgi:hypothetical protein